MGEDRDRVGRAVEQPGGEGERAVGRDAQVVAAVVLQEEGGALGEAAYRAAHTPQGDAGDLDAGHVGRADGARAVGDGADLRRARGLGRHGNVVARLEGDRRGEAELAISVEVQAVPAVVAEHERRPIGQAAQGAADRIEVALEGRRDRHRRVDQHQAGLIRLAAPLRPGGVVPTGVGGRGQFDGGVQVVARLAGLAAGDAPDVRQDAAVAGRRDGQGERRRLAEAREALQPASAVLVTRAADLVAAVAAEAVRHVGLLEPVVGDLLDDRRVPEGALLLVGQIDGGAAARVGGFDPEAAAERPVDRVADRSADAGDVPVALVATANVDDRSRSLRDEGVPLAELELDAVGPVVEAERVVVLQLVLLDRGEAAARLGPLLGPAVGAAGAAGVGVAVVAGLVLRIVDAVAAVARGRDLVAGRVADQAVGAARRAAGLGDRVAVVALLAGGQVELAVAAHGHRAVGVARGRLAPVVADLAEADVELAVATAGVRAVAVAACRLAPVVADLAEADVELAVAAARGGAVGVAGGRLARGVALLAEGGIELAVAAAGGAAVGVAGGRLAAVVALLAGRGVEVAVPAAGPQAVGVAERRVSEGVALLARRGVDEAVAAEGGRAVGVAGGRVARGVAPLAGNRVVVAVAAPGVGAVGVAGGAVDLAEVVALLARGAVDLPVAAVGRGAVGVAGVRLARVVADLAAGHVEDAVATEGDGAVGVAAGALAPVVTLLACRAVEDSVAAAGRGAVVVAALRLAALVAFLAGGRVVIAVAAQGDGAVAVAAVGVAAAEHVALLVGAGVDDAVAAGGQGAVDVAVGRLARVVTLLGAVRADEVEDAVAADVEPAVRQAIAVVVVVGPQVTLLARVDHAVAAVLLRPAVGRAAVAREVVAVVAHLAGGAVELVVAASGLGAVGVAARGLAAVVALLARGAVDVPVAAAAGGAVGVALGGLAGLPLVAGLALDRVDVPVAARLGRLAVGRAAVAAADVAVVADLAGGLVARPVAAPALGAVGVAGGRLALVVTGLAAGGVGVPVAAAGEGAVVVAGDGVDAALVALLARVDHAVAAGLVGTTVGRAAVAVLGVAVVAHLAGGPVDLPVAADGQGAVVVAAGGLALVVALLVCGPVDPAVAAGDRGAVAVAARRVHPAVVADLALDGVHVAVAAVLGRKAVARAAVAGDRVAVVAHLAGGPVELAVAAAILLAVGVAARRLAPVVALLAEGGVGVAVAAAREGAVDVAVRGVAGHALDPVVALLVDGEVDDAVAAALVRGAVGRAAVAVDGVAVVAHLALVRVEDAVAAGLIGQAVRAAPVVRALVPVVADLADVGVDDPVAARLGRMAVGAAVVAVLGVAVVADLADQPVDDAVAAGLVRLAIGRAAVAVDGVAVVAGLALLHFAVAAFIDDADRLVLGAALARWAQHAGRALDARGLDAGRQGQGAESGRQGPQQAANGSDGVWLHRSTSRNGRWPTCHWFRRRAAGRCSPRAARAFARPPARSGRAAGG